MSKEFVRLASGPPIGYNLDKKAKFARLGKWLLQSIAIKLGLPHGSYEVRYNAGGIAVSGDVILHGESIYINFSQSALGPEQGFMYRHCKGKRDYTGGMNRWMQWHELLDLDEACKKLARAVVQDELPPIWGLSGP